MSNSLEKSADCVRVKAEPSWDFAKPELVEHIDHVVKTEASESDETAWGLNNNHEVKEELKNKQVGLIDQDIKAEELVLGPEEFQQPKVTLVCRGSWNMSRQICSIRLEQMRVDMENHTCTIGQNTYKFRQYILSYDNCTEENNTSINKLDRETQHITDTEHPGAKSSSNKSLIHKKTLVRKKLYKCDLCNYSSDNKHNFNRHETKHSGDKPYKCVFCSYAATQKFYLKKHYETKHTGNNNTYKCAHCGYTTDSKSLFDHHNRSHIHARRKPYKCKYCRYAASEEADITVHETIHNGVNPYKCAFCSYTTSYKRSLKIHQMIHNGGNPYKCASCNYITFRESKLKEHEITHKVKPEKMYGKVG
ncbi:zinc finger protein 14-like isoform X1 [Cydia pomonella]|uniref:zinc finger protein 14-like isoform X1 n=1 Tax=Cydia pomonella TaxID=82600 RepID=UPI002ADDC5AC|nr:zinc finger protein 14-like isoform X1 [Cydia pomonella]